MREPVALQDLSTPLTAMLSRAATAPERVAFLFEDDAWTYARLRRESERLAGAMRSLGVAPGDRVVLHMLNHPETLVSYLATFWLGAVAVPVSPHHKADEFRALMRHVRPSIYLGQADLADALARTPAEILGADRRLAVGATDGRGGPLPWDDLLARSDDVGAVAIRHDPDAPAILFGTSGTTGRSKLVVWTGRTVAAVGHAARERLLSDRDIVLHAGPMMHASGIDTWARCLFNELPMVLLRTFEPEAVLDAIERHRCTFFAHLPYTFLQLARHQRERRRDLESLQSCIAWGDVCPPETAAAFRELTGVPVLSMWSSTEDAGSGAPASEPGPVTRFVSGVETRIVDEADRVVGDGAVGELVVRSPATTPGYWTGPGAIDELPDGWFRTGDLLRREAPDRFRYMGRQKQLIVRAGYNVSPVEVENVLRDDPAVADAVVFGLDDREFGQRITASVVLRTGTGASAEQVLDRVRAQVADYKIPERLIVVDAIPRNASGKVDRDAAAEAVRDARPNA